MKSKETYWLLLNPSVFVDFISDSFVSIYDTRSATYMTSTDQAFINTLNQIFLPENNGSILFDNSYVCKDLKTAQSLDYFFIVKSNKRPVNLLPILNLQSDILRGDSIQHRLALISSKLSLLSGLKIELAPMISGRISNPITNKRLSMINQYCVHSNLDQEFSDIDKLMQILERLSLTSVASIDLYCNKNIFLKKESIIKFLKVIPSFINIHITIEDFYMAKDLILSSIQNKSVRIKIYADEHTNLKHILDCIEAKYDIYYFIYSEQGLKAIQYYNDKLNLCPVILDDNVEWIKSIFSINSNSIASNANSFNHIFRNMKLNANFFGILDITVNGNVIAHGSKKILGNILDNNFSLIQSVEDALKNDDAWRKTRDRYPNCSLCAFRYICPPVSIFEIKGLIDTICMND